MAQVSRKATIRGLEMTGWTVDETARTTKYVVFHRPGTDRRYLVGRSGALRVMRPGDTVATSTSLTGNRWHRAICQLADGGYKPETTVDACDVLERIYDSLRVERHAPSTQPPP